jgi:hypothetical protein
MLRVPIMSTLILGRCLAFAAGCREEGPGERAGRQIDEAVEEGRDASEGALEKLGREVDEAVEESQEAADEIRDAAKESGG